MASPARDARLKVLQTRPNAQVIERGRGHLRMMDDSDPLNPIFIYDGQSSGIGWHLSDLQTEVDTAWVTGDSTPYRLKMELAEYNCYAGLDDAVNFDAGQIVQYVHPATGEDITFQPQQIQWTNDLGQIQPIGDPAQVGAVVNDDILRWNAAYGLPGVDFEWQTQAVRLAKLLIVDALGSLPAPTAATIAGGNPVFKLPFIFQKSNGVDVYVNGVLWNEQANNPQETFDNIEFRAGGEVLWSFNAPRAWSSERGDVLENVKQVVRKQGPNLLVEVHVPWSWIETATFPIYIDPTVDAQVTTDTSNDGYDYASSYLQNNPFKMGKKSSNVIYAGNRFLSVSIPSGATITAAVPDWCNKWNGNYATLIKTNIYGEESGTPNAYGNSDRPSGRTITSASSAFDSVAEDIGDGTWYSETSSNNPPDITSAIQEVVDTVGAVTDLSIIIIDDGSSSDWWWEAYDYSGDTSLAGKIHIEYTAGSTGTAAVSPLVVSLTPPAVTADYTQVEAAAVTPLAATITVVAVTATYTQIETAGVAPAIVTLTPTVTTASGSQTATAAVSPLQATITILAVTATYTQVETAAVAPVLVTLIPTATTASGATAGTASVTPLPITMTVASVTATYIQTETAALAPLVVTMTIPAITSSYVQVDTAAVLPLATSITMPAVTAAHAQVNSAVVAPLVANLLPVAPAATYQEVDSAPVIPLVLLIALVSVTADTGTVIKSIGFSRRKATALFDRRSSLLGPERRKSSMTMDIE